MKDYSIAPLPLLKHPRGCGFPLAAGAHGGP
jgi:hypothetical protein